MKITNDVNNNSDFLSVSNKGEENTSLLGSLFSINFNSNEVKSNNVSDDFEFTSLVFKFIENNEPNKEVLQSPLFEIDKKSELLFTSFVIFILNSIFQNYLQIQCHY